MSSRACRLLLLLLAVAAFGDGGDVDRSSYTVTVIEASCSVAVQGGGSAPARLMRKPGVLGVSRVVSFEGGCGRSGSLGVLVRF